MSIFKVKNSGNWYYKFVYNGRQVKRSAGAGATKQEARKLGEKHLEQLKEESKLLKLGIPINRTFGDACLEFINQGYLMDSMRSHMRCTLKHLVDIPLEEAHVEARYMAARMREDGLKDNTINRRLAVVIRVLNVAYNHWDGWLSQPTASKIQKFDESEYAREYYLSADEVADFVEAMPNDEIKPWFLLLAYTGLRQSEMLNLKPDQWSGECINLRSNTKSGKPRAVPVPQDLQYLMDELPCPFEYQDLRRNWEAARKQTGIAKWRIHDYADIRVVPTSVTSPW